MPSYSRRDFTRLLALSGSAALLPGYTGSRGRALYDDVEIPSTPLPRTPVEPDEKFWQDVRARFLLPRDLGFFNAANLCPMSLPVVEALERNTRRYETNPSPAARTELMQGREEARRLLAAALRVTPEEIVITRNTSEANNLVSSGLQLGPNDEIIAFADNHPSNLSAWREKARRFGFSVSVVPLASPHPGPEYYVDAFAKAITPRTRVLAITHLTSNAGDLFPVAELCRMARERGVLSLVDGAQTFGALDVNLSEMRPDFYSGSAHKWPCGPKETGLLFVARDVHDRVWPSIVGLYAGAVGISQKLEANGQRDDASLAAFAEALKFQDTIGRAVIERRVRQLAQHMIEELRRLDGVTIWTHPDPSRSAGIVVFRPGSLDPRRLGAALYEKDRIVCTVRGGSDRSGLRLSPHIYCTVADVDRALAAVRRYLASGV